MSENRYAKSDADADYLLHWTPGGSQTGSKAPGKAGPRGGYPSVLDHACGAWVTDVDGNAYCDWVASLAAVGLGHGQPDVVSAVRRQLGRGSLLSLPMRLEGEASEELCGFLGWPEQVRWLKTGSEATEAAVRVARIATGRDHVATVESGYHGWHSWFQAVKPEHPGVPRRMTGLIDGFAYGSTDRHDVRGGDLFLALEGKSYACVILEPAPLAGGGDAAWLRALKDVCRRTGTVLVFDEMVWGLRLARAGGTQHFGVYPDLATYGKALGNGVPVAALVGPRELMRHAGVVSGTFGGDGLGLAAAVAVMRLYSTEPVIPHMWEVGNVLWDGLVTLAVNCPLTMSVEGYPVRPILRLRTDDAVADTSLLLQTLADWHVLWHPGGANVMYAHTVQHAQTTLVAMEAALNEVCSASASGGSRTRLRGEPYAQAFARAR